MPILVLDSGRYGTSVEQFLLDHKDQPNVAIRGQGAGQTFIECPVSINGWRPEIQDVCIAPVDSGVTCLDLTNIESGYIRNVWCNVPVNGTGISSRITVDARNGPANWAPRGEETSGAFNTLTVFDSVFVRGENVSGSKGWVFDSDFDWDQMGEGFLNHQKIINGHTIVEDQAFNLNRVNHVMIMGHHADVQAYKGVHIGIVNYGVHWYCPGFVEPRWSAKSTMSPIITGNVSEFNYYNRWYPAPAWHFE